MFDRIRLAAGVGFIVLGLTACGINAPGGNPTLIVTAIPTNTLAPIVTTTERFTATPIPSPTFIPTATPLPSETPLEDVSTLTATPTATPTAAIRAVVRIDGGIVNMRVGPGATYRVMGNLKPGSPIQVLFSSTDGKWILVVLDDGSEGWVSQSLLTLINPSVTVPALTTPELTQRAVEGTAFSKTQTAIAPTAGGGQLIASGAPTHAPKINQSTDVLAYCDQPGSDATRNRKFAAGAAVVVFWSWVAKTPEQIKDHLNNAQYEVKVDGQLVGDWQKFGSAVTQQRDGSYIVYWFVPLAAQVTGTHKIDYKLTWTQSISDGTKQFGPGTSETTDTGTCSFSVK